MVIRNVWVICSIFLPDSKHQSCQCPLSAIQLLKELYYKVACWDWNSWYTIHCSYSAGLPLLWYSEPLLRMMMPLFCDQWVGVYLVLSGQLTDDIISALCVRQCPVQICTWCQNSDLRLWMQCLALFHWNIEGLIINYYQSASFTILAHGTCFFKCSIFRYFCEGLFGDICMQFCVGLYF